MTKDDIIKLAGEAGFFVKDAEAYIPSIQYDHELTPYLELFYNLVAEREREECAKVCSEAAVKLKTFFNLINMHTADVLQEITAAIRARGTT